MDKGMILDDENNFSTQNANQSKSKKKSKSIDKKSTSKKKSEKSKEKSSKSCDKANTKKEVQQSKFEEINAKPIFSSDKKIKQMDVIMEEELSIKDPKV